ncbi:hypothetical protein ESCO_002867 [Escovopsis weberi]|uniref:Uncharacterized protein n=1 Tax=Escovopsis weberi TaxID=150374 RepID=A0A0M9VSY2_ESCWE|nr:hypothetical protein ESCO_002867 [Escovopsis weberi]
MGECDVQGDSDLYGGGVRYGLYMQWAATLLATLFDQRNENALRSANLAIQVSIFIGLCLESGAGHPVANAVITQYLFIGSLSSVTGDGISYVASFAGLMRSAFYLALSAYGIWFWSVGVDVMSAPGCAAHEIAFLGSITVHGRFRKFGIAASCIGLVVCIALTARGLVLVARRFQKGVRSGLLGDSNGGGQLERPRVDVGLLALSIALMVFSIVLIEHLVGVNQVDVDEGDSFSVGQAIPFFMGTLSATVTFWNSLAVLLKWQKRCWFFMTIHL